MTVTRRKLATPVIGAVLAVAVATSAYATPLEVEACGRVLGDIKNLEGLGVRQWMAKGPEAGRTLSADQKVRIKRLLDLEAQLKFRCPQDKPIIVLREDNPDDMLDQVLDDNGKPIAPPAGAPKGKAIPKTAAPTVPQTEASKQKGATGIEPVVTPAKPAPKKRPDDAFRPNAATQSDPAQGPVVPPLLKAPN